ncbi:MAG: AMP-binding protein [Pseudomonadota bacterium]
MDWYRKRTLGDVLDEAARRWPNRDAFVFEDRVWTYAEWLEETNRVAKALIASGVRDGDRVALWLTNRPEWLFLMFAIPKVGAGIVPLNTRYRTDDVAYTLSQSRSQTLISLDTSGPIDYRAMLAESMPDLDASHGRLQLAKFPELERMIFIGANALPNTMMWGTFLERGAQVSDQQLSERAATVDPDGLMLIAYTSGTTGHPKGVMHSHVPIRNTQERAQVFGFTFDDVHLNYLPLFHLYAFSEISLMAAITGGKQVLMDVFDADRALDAAEAHRASVLHGFEAHWLDLIAAQEARPRSLSVRLGTLPSGVETTVPVAERAHEVIAPTVSGFGMSEAWAFVTCSNPGHAKEQRIYASGFPMNDYEIRIADPETGQELPAGTSGEILVRGYAVMKGYWDKPEATAEAIDSEGWLHSGDMGMLRPDGHLVFQGRYKDMLKVGGENVSPAEVESYLREMPEVIDAAVVSLPDKRLTEVPVAFILADRTTSVDGEALIARCKGRIASFKIPRHVITLSEFPMTPSGKIRKVELRALAIERLGSR